MTVRDALTGRRSAVRTAAKTQQRDLWGCPALSKNWLNSGVFPGTAKLREGGLLLFFDTRVHTVLNKELYSLMISCVKPPSLHHPAHSCPSNYNECISLFLSCQSKIWTDEKKTHLDETAAHGASNPQHKSNVDHWKWSIQFERSSWLNTLSMFEFTTLTSECAAAHSADRIWSEHLLILQSMFVALEREKPLWLAEVVL